MILVSCISTVQNAIANLLFGNAREAAVAFEVVWGTDAPQFVTSVLAVHHAITACISRDALSAATGKLMAEAV